MDGFRDDVQDVRDLDNVERVEALKGPNAMIFGRGGAGGVLNRTTRQANWAAEREATVQVGSFDNRRAMFDVGDRAGNRAAVRATAMDQNSDSYREGVGLERYGVNPTVAFAVGSGTIVRAGYERFHDERTADRGVPSWNGRPFQTDPSTFFGDADESVARATVDALTAGLEHRFTQRVAPQPHPIRDLRQVLPERVRRRRRTAGRPERADRGVQQPDRPPEPVQPDRSDVFLTTGRFRHTVVVGGELGRQSTDNFRETGYFGTDVTTVLAPIDSPHPSVPVNFRQSASDADNHGVATVAALYAQDQVELSQHVQAVVGLRYDDFRVDFRNNRTGDAFETVDWLFSPRAGLIVKPVEAVSLYTSYSLAYVPRAGEQLASLTLSNEALEPERFTNYEVGAKWDVRPTLSFTSAVFRLDYAMWLSLTRWTPRVRCWWTASGRRASR